MGKDKADDDTGEALTDYERGRREGYEHGYQVGRREGYTNGLTAGRLQGQETARSANVVEDGDAVSTPENDTEDKKQ